MIVLRIACAPALGMKDKPCITFGWLMSTPHVLASVLPVVRLKIVRRSAHPSVFLRMVARPAIQAALAAHYPDSRFYWFAEDQVQKQESFDCRSPEAPPAEVITENGVRFRVAPGSKHKTGFFLDQRDNRQALATFCAGRRVL